MEKEEFYRLLDIESGRDFKYFENVAELFESSETIGQDLIYGLMKDADCDIFAELADGYFDEIENYIPDNETDFYILVDNIKRVMCGIAGTVSVTEDETDRDGLLTQLSDEIGRFREWYSLSDNVECVSQAERREMALPVRDALTLLREEALGGDSWDLDFSGALDYDLSDFVYSFADASEHD